MTLGNRTKVAAVAAAAAMLLAACGSGGGGGGGGATTGGGGAATDGGARGGTLTLGILGTGIQSWDPGQAHVGHALQPYQPVYDTLLLREPDGTLSPMLATEWGYNDDNTVLTLDLRTDVTFSDGATFDAEAAKANFEHFKAFNGPQAAMLANVSEVTVVDEDTVEIALSAADPAMEYYLSQAAGLMGSPEALGTDEISTVPVGSGPYVMNESSTVGGSQYVFDAREDYWNPDLQRFDQIVLKPLVDLTARVNAIVSGQIDATLLDPRSVAQAEGAGLLHVSSQVDWSGLLLMDREGALAPALGDVRVRQAINHALDKETMLAELQLGYGTVTSQVFGQESGAWVEELEDYYDFDPDKARDLLAEAGYPDGFSFTAPAFPGTETVFAVIAQQLADVGITMEQQPVAASEVVASIRSGNYPVAWFNLFQGEPWVAINQMIAPNATYNPFVSTTPELQTMIDAVQTGGEESATLAQDVNRYVTENAWFAPFYRTDQMYFINDDKITVEPQIQMAVPSIYNYAPVG